MKQRMQLRKVNEVVPVFLAADDKYVKFMAVTIKSVIENASFQYRYRLHILHTDITVENQMLIKRMETPNCEIQFVDVTNEMKKIEKRISLRDYYTATTYYRVFIAELFPRYDKVIYIDSDTIVREDIAQMYKYNLGKNYIGAVRDQLIVQTELYGTYAEKVLGISRGAYFNAGVVLINCQQFRRKGMLNRFIDLLGIYTFVVAQDQDYLNILCKDHVLWMDPRWNAQMAGKLSFDEQEIKLVHYNLAMKPWHYQSCRFGKYFWRYAKQTEKYEELQEVLNKYSKEDEERDRFYGENLQNLAISEIQNIDNYYRKYGKNQPVKLTREEVLRRIEDLERKGIFDKDVEEDPPAKELLPEEVDYLRKNIKSKLCTKYAFKMARWFVSVLVRKKQFVIKDIVGIEHFRNLETGAVITCNHFNAYDSFAMHIAYERAGHQSRKLYRVISEANYTTFPGFYGFLMRNCNTLPLSSNKTTMKKFLWTVNYLLQKGHFVLVYPEQSMWWNYRKPKPLKKGAYAFAVNSNVPVLPCFITMEDTENLDMEGYPVQAYTIHIGEAINPEPDKSKAENVKQMLQKNSQIWKEIYENTYGISLNYTWEEEQEKM